MTQVIEILDALPGCGKTTAIFKYMAEQTTERWIYVSPVRKEINERACNEADTVGLDIFIAVEKGQHEEDKTKVLQVLEALKEGRNIACTHNLLLRFTDEHLELLKLFNYNVICDEELELISGYKGLSVKDINLLLKNENIHIDEVSGKITCLTNDLIGTKYDAVHQYASFECLYAAVKRNQFLVLQLSPRVIHLAKRFILLTYNYPGSIMDTFMQMNGISYKALEGVHTYKTSAQITKQVMSLVSFIETPSVKRWQNKKNTLSSTWWYNSATDSDIETLGKICSSILALCKVGSDKVMITLPKSNYTGRETLSGKIVKRFKAKKLVMEDAYVSSKARATNDYEHKEVCIHMYNIYPNQAIVAYLQDRGYFCNSDAYALNTYLQWLFRSRLRNGEPVKVAILSSRMSSIFKEWLMKTKD